MDLSILIVTWNTRDILLECLESIGQHAPQRAYEIIVVDNASTDGTVESLRRFPEIRVIANSRNCGFAAGNNQGLQASSGRYVLLLNPDTIVHPRSLEALCDFMDRNEDVAACGPRLLNADGTLQPSARRFPTFRGALYRYTPLRSLGIFRSHYRRWLMKDFRHDRQTDVDQLMGSALLLRKSWVERVGPLDEQFFLYFEEVDLCRRIKQAGGRIVFTPEAVITHLGGRSSRQVPVEKSLMAMESLLRYFRKHRGRRATALFSCAFKPGILLQSLCQALGGVTTYGGALLTSNYDRRSKSAATIRNSTLLLTKHTWRLLFKA
ncbi:MAG: glycosyltransferase family 2 protein [Solirubrobacterales bacterium]